jgi:hypothetical protein
MRLTCDVDISGLLERMTRTRHAVRQIQVESVQAAGNIAVARARQSTAFKDRTGNLRRLINSSNIRWDGTEAFIWFTSPASYSVYVEEGTKAHEIWPKEGHGFIGPLRSSQGRREITDIGTHRVALRWFVGSKIVFARMVHHPGTEPHHYMTPAAEYAGGWLREILERKFIGLQRIWD